MSNFYWLLWDSAAVVLVIVCVYLCARRGLLRTLLGFCAYVLAMLAARKASPMASEYLYDNAVAGMVRSVLKDSMENAVSEAAGTARELPLWMQALLELTPESQTTLVDSMTDSVMENALAGPVLWVLEGLCFLVIFSLTFFLLRTFSRLLGGLNRVPVVGTVNSILGGCIGLLEAVILLFAVAFALGVIILMTGNRMQWLNREVLDSTFVLRVFFDRVFPY